MFFELLNKQASDKYFEVGKGSEIKDSFHIKKIETRAAPMLQIKKNWKLVLMLYKNIIIHYT